ncbi:MAG: subclass B3 metallo-beta-lactamase [Rudaea sp.]
MKILPLSALAAMVALAHAFVARADGAADPLAQAAQSGAEVQWNQAQTPMKIYGNTYYVGVAGLSSILIRTDAGLILLDGDMPQSALLIEANIRGLGFKVADIKLILNSHAHRDHAGGIAALQRASGAEVVASPSAAKALRDGHVAADDPQAAIAESARFPAAARVREVRDSETVHVGTAAVTAHFTTGHTPGSTTWTWKDCAAGRCLNIVYADSLSVVSAPNFHFLADATHADLTGAFRHSMQTVAALPCDILITVHPQFADIPRKLEQLAAHGAPNPFIDPHACRAYAAAALTKLDARIAEERAATR